MKLREQEKNPQESDPQEINQQTILTQVGYTQAMNQQETNFQNSIPPQAVAQGEEKPKKKKRWLILPLLLLLLFVLAGGAALGFYISGGIKQPVPDPVPTSPSDGGLKLQLDPNAGEYVPPATEEAEELPGVVIPGWVSITIASNQTNVAVDFYNPEANADYYDLTFELRLLDDSEEGYEVLYTSGLVEPGLHLQKIDLTRGLPAGEYDAVIHVQPYLMDDTETPTNNADIKITLFVR